MSNQCEEKVPGEGRWGFVHMHRCSNAAKAERDGKSYCNTHDPVRVKERREKKYQERQDNVNLVLARREQERQEFITRVIEMGQLEHDVQKTATRLVDEILSTGRSRARSPLW